MKAIIFLLMMVSLAGCGSGSGASCSETDTSQAPDSIINSGSVTTYTWGNCTKVYYNY